MNNIICHTKKLFLLLFPLFSLLNAMDNPHENPAPYECPAPFPEWPPVFKNCNEQAMDKFFDALEHHEDDKARIILKQEGIDLVDRGGSTLLTYAINGRSARFNEKYEMESDLTLW